MIASFLGISGRLRRPSLVPNVLHVIRKYAVGIAIIHTNVFPFMDIEWLPCEGFLALMAVLLPLVCTV